MARQYSRILVTGGAGFIGSHLVDRLLVEGFEVTVLDDLSSGSQDNIARNRRKKGFKFVRGDVRDPEIAKKTLEDMDAVFHEAALVSVPISVKDPVLVTEVNVQGTLNLLKASSDAHVKRFIYASSASVYGNTAFSKVGEDAVANPISPLGISKLAAELYARYFHRSLGLDTVILRYFNVYGPRQSFDPQFPYSGVITIFMNSLLSGKPPTIYGDGKQTRDFVYVQDVVEANLLALQTKKAAGEAFNVGGGRGVSINEVADTLRIALDKQGLQNVYADSRPGDIKHSCADIGKARKILGYGPKCRFDEGISRLVNWYNDMRNE